MMLRLATRFWYPKSIIDYVGLAIAALLLTWLRLWHDVVTPKVIHLPVFLNLHSPLLISKEIQIKDAVWKPS